jgi:hypothetical protein
VRLRGSGNPCIRSQLRMRSEGLTPLQDEPHSVAKSAQSRRSPAHQLHVAAQSGYIQRHCTAGRYRESVNSISQVDCDVRMVTAPKFHATFTIAEKSSARIRVKLPPSHHPQTNNNKPRVARWRVSLRWSPALVVNRRGAIRPRKRRVGINLTGHIVHVMTLRFETAARGPAICEAFTSLG